MIRIFEKVSSPQAVFLELPDMIEVGRRLQLGALSPHPSHLLLCSLLLCYLLFFLEKKKREWRWTTWVSWPGLRWPAELAVGEVTSVHGVSWSPHPRHLLLCSSQLPCSLLFGVIEKERRWTRSPHARHLGHLAQATFCFVLHFLV